MIVKIKLSLLLVFFISITAYSQETQDAIIVRKEYYGKTLKNILDDLARTYNLDIDYNVEDVMGGIVRGRSYNMTLDKVLDFVLENKDLHYKIVENKVVIRKLDMAIDLKEVVYSRKSDFKLSGIVKDKSTGESLPFAQIIVSGTQNGATTNVDGYFTLFNVPSDTSAIEVHYMGYKRLKAWLNPKLVTKDLVIKLIPDVKEIKEVTVAAEGNEIMKVAEEISVVSISPKEIAALPSLGEQDIFRSFQLLPGISGSNESSSGLYVRGGTPDQNLILYDGFTVYHVDHLFGMFSAFNSNAIKDVKLHKGGFESKFGGRTSSVMEITGKDGNENDFNLGGGIGFISANAFAEIPLAGNGSILITGRRSFQSFLYNNIFESFNSSEEPQGPEGMQRPGGGMGNRMQATSEPSSYFYDLNAKATYKLKKDIFSLSFYNGQDDLDNSNEMDMAFGNFNASGGTNDITKWGNWGSSLKWSRKWSDVFYSNALVSYSNYYSQRDLTRTRDIVREDTSFTMSMGSLEDNNLQDYSFKMDNEWKTGQNNQVEFGIQANHYQNDYDFNRNDTIEIQNRHDKANLISGYVQDKVDLYNRLTFIPGIRTSFYGTTKKFYFEPRASLQYKINKQVKLKAAWGVYNQFAKRIVRDDIESGSRDFWMLADDDVIPITNSTHYIAGASYETSNYLFDVEAYYKDLKGLSEYTMVFIPSFGRGREMNYDEYYYEGTGYAKGIEFLAQKKYGKHTGWIGYTLGEVIYDFPDYGQGAFPANHDVTHEFKIVESYKWKKWTFSGTWIYATGKPYTAPVGGYELTMADGSTNDYITIGEKNMFRLPDYHRLDLSANLHFNMGTTGNGTLGFSVFNVYNRVNTWYKTFEIIEGEMLETDVNLLGITPNVSLTIKLR